MPPLTCSVDRGVVDDRPAVLDGVVSDHVRHAAGDVDLDQREVGAARVDLGRIDTPHDVEPGRQVILGNLAERLDQAREAADRAAADEGAAARRAGVGVALEDVHQCGIDSELPGGQQAMGLGMALAGLGAAREDLDPALRGHPDPGAVVPRYGGDAAPPVLGRAGPAVLVEEADPDPEKTTFGASRGLPAPELGVGGTGLEPLKEAEVVAGVEVAPGRAAARELGDRVAAANLKRVEIEPGGGDVDHPLGRVGAGVHPDPAVGAGGALVAGQCAGVVPDRMQGVGTEEGLRRRHRLQRSAEGKDRIRADVGHHRRVDGQEAPLGIERQPDRHLLLVGVSARDEVLAPVLDPADRASQPEGERRHHDLLREDVRLEAEPAPHLGRDHADRLLRQPQAARDQGPGQVRHLGRGPDRDPAAGGGGGGDAAVLERERRRAGGPKRLLQDQRRPAELGVHVAAFILVPEEVAVRGLRVDGRAFCHRLVLEEDALGKVLGVVAIPGEGDGDRLARVADAPFGERRPAARDHARALNRDRIEAEAGGVEDVLREVGHGERRVGHGRADEGGLERAGQLEVGQVGRPAEDLQSAPPATSRIASTIGA